MKEPTPGPKDVGAEKRCRAKNAELQQFWKKPSTWWNDDKDDVDFVVKSASKGLLLKRYALVCMRILPWTALSKEDGNIIMLGGRGSLPLALLRCRGFHPEFVSHPAPLDDTRLATFHEIPHQMDIGNQD